jgi:hypothetical protein
MMVNELETLKALVGVSGDSLSLDDQTVLAGLSQTAFEFWLDAAATAAGLDIARWLGVTPVALPATTATRMAEVLLVQSEIVHQFGICTALSEARIKVGGDDGNEIDIRHIAAEERALEAESLRRRAYRLVTGNDAPAGFAGVLG